MNANFKKYTQQVARLEAQLNEVFNEVVESDLPDDHPHIVSLNAKYIALRKELKTVHVSYLQSEQVRMKTLDVVITSIPWPEVL